MTRRNLQAAPPNPTAMARAAHLLLALLLAGCLRVGPGEDLHLVCEDESTSPRPGYFVRDLVALVDVEDETLSAPERDALFDAARPHLLTRGGSPHPRFEGSLTREPSAEPAAWRLRATGSDDDPATPDDTYDVRLTREGATVRATPGAPTLGPIAVPDSILASATTAVSRDTRVVELLDGTPHLAGAGWDPQLPGCVRLAYRAPSSEAGPPAQPGAFVLVNVDSMRVVHVERAGA